MQLFIHNNIRLKNENVFHQVETDFTKKSHAKMM